MRISKSMIKSGLAAFVLLLSVTPAASRTCFLPDSEDCGEVDTNVSDISDVGSCRYYNCKDAGYKNDNPYQECYVENTVNIKNNRVSCYAVRCKMSQPECEEKAEGTNKCCNRDVASGCYYVGTCPKECDRSVYSYDSEQTGDGWTCISCHDGKGTFYKCNYDKTCEEQGYATSCSDEQIAEEVTGAKGQNGEKCYTCKGKPLSCPDGYSTTVKTCATGYKLETNGAIEGVACGKCVEESCPSGYATSTTSCPSGYTLETNGKSGSKICGKCVENVLTCDASKGWFKTEAECYTGHPDSICSQDRDTKCWIGQCDIQGSPGYYSTRENCENAYQDYCIDDCSNPDACQVVDEDSNCYYIDCYQLGYFDRKSDCEKNGVSCNFDEGLRCYYPAPVVCDAREGLFATEKECENFGILGPARCTREGNCYRPDVARIFVDYAVPHDDVPCGGGVTSGPGGGDRFEGEYCDLSYGKLSFYRSYNYPNKISLECKYYYCKEQEINAGTYIMETYGAGGSIYAGGGYVYVYHIDIAGGCENGVCYENAEFDSRNQEADEVNDGKQHWGRYPMKYEFQKNWGRDCSYSNHSAGIFLGKYYRYALEYTFKGGMSYSISAIDENYNKKSNDTICCNETSQYLCNDKTKTPIEVEGWEKSYTHW